MDPLTEEKLNNIVEKVDDLKDSIAHQTAVIEEVRDLETANANKVNWLNGVVDEHHKLFYNAGKDGIIQRVDRLEQRSKGRMERVYLLLSVASLIATIVIAFFK